MRKAERKRDDTIGREISQGALPEVLDNTPQRRQYNGVDNNRWTCQEIVHFAGGGL
jgi:hypothetical protein